MKTIRWPLMTSFSVLVLAAACGKANKPAGPSYYKEELKTDGSNINGTYSAVLFPVNINLHAPKSGMAAFTRHGDELVAKVKLDVGAKGAMYRQAVYWGNRCPGIEADKNKDGYIDMPEMEATLGDIIIPLDGDLDSQSGGTGMYPSGANLRGSYFYKRTASFSRFFEDLKIEDPNTHDRVRKLDGQAGFTFLNKVVLIQGATADYRIPETVSSYYGLSRLRSLPIACGVLYKSNKGVADEMETPIVNSDGEPDDSPIEDDTTTTDPGPVVTNPTPTPAPGPVVTEPRPTPAPTPAPSRPRTDNTNNNGDDDGGVIDSVRDWWNRVTHNDDDDND